MVTHSGAPIPGSQCTVCGRQWRYRLGDRGGVFVDVFPVTEKAPPATIRTRPPNRVTSAPTGADFEIPPDDLIGPARCRWWDRWRELRLAARRAA